MIFREINRSARSNGRNKHPDDHKFGRDLFDLNAEVANQMFWRFNGRFCPEDWTYAG